MSKGNIKRCSPRRSKLKPEEILTDLSGYKRVKRLSDLKEWDRVKYFRRDTLEYRKGGWVVSIDKKDKYIVIEGFSRNWRTCKNIRFSINWNDVIIFKNKDIKRKEDIKVKVKKI